MRADRLLSILLLLQIHRRMTARELADKLEVSERTIHRDMEALGISGVPVMAERGNGGGWTLPKGYRTDLTGLNQPEIQSLFLGRPSRLMTDLGMQEVSETALTKLMAALPPIQRLGAEYARQRIYVDTASWRRSGEDISLLPTLQDAIWQERKLLFAYQRSDGAVSERVADPLGLVAKGNIWYLVAAVAAEPRTYRVSRIRCAAVLGEPSVRPEPFDLAGYWAQSEAEFIAGLPRYEAVVRVAPGVAGRLWFGGRFAKVGQPEPPDADGWQRVSIRFDTAEIAAEYALSFGPQLEVLEPEALREQVIGLAERTVAFYASRP